MTTARTDRWGATLQTGNDAGVARFDEAVEGLLSLSGEPVAAAEAAVVADPDLILGQILRAYFSLYRTCADGVVKAAALLKPLQGAEAAVGEREILHLRAARAWSLGDWDGATRSLERALLHDSKDVLALKVAQDLYFFLGRTSEIQSVVTRSLRAWSPGREGWSFIQGMYAFGLEENGDYAQAELFARAALHHNPRDVWAAHALAHVFEMEGRPREGVTFLAESEAEWSSSFFATHTWWHRALYHLELGEPEHALALYEGPIHGAYAGEWLRVVDAASLLWRLSLFGVDVGVQSAELAAELAPLIDSPTYIFNDWHAVMAFALAGEHEAAEHLLTSNRRGAVGTNRSVAEQAGLALLEAFDAFASGRLGLAIDLLSDVRPFAATIGGSQAQRDVIDLTLIVAHARAGAQATARRMVAERVTRRPSTSASARRLLALHTP